jgi:hypothetical protein
MLAATEVAPAVARMLLTDRLKDSETDLREAKLAGWATVDAEPLAVAEGERVPVADGVAVGDRLPLAVIDGLDVSDGLEEPVGVCVDVPLALPLLEGLAVRDDDTLGLPLALEDDVAVELPVSLLLATLGVAVTLPLLDNVAEDEPVPELEAVSEADAEAEIDALGLRLPDADTLGLSLLVALPLLVIDSLGLPERLLDAETVLEAVRDDDGVSEALTLPLGVLDRLPLALTLAEAVIELDAVELAVCDSLAVTEPVLEPVSDEEGVCGECGAGGARAERAGG